MRYSLQKQLSGYGRHAVIIRREMKEKANLNWRGDGEFVHGGENGCGRLLSRRDGSMYTSQMSIKVPPCW